MDKARELATLVRSIAHSLVVVTNDGLGDQGGEVVVVAPADTLNSDGNVGGGDGVVADADVRANKVGLGLGLDIGAGLGGLAGQVGEVLVGKLDELLVGDTTSSGEDHAVGSVVLLDVVDKFGAGNVADVLTGAQDGTAERLVLEGGRVEVVKDDLLKLLLNLLRLAQDHVTLTLDGGLVEF